MKTAKKKNLRKILIFVIALLTLTGLITAIFVMSTNVQEVRGWYNSNWMYRKAINIQNLEAEKTDADFLYSLDTATLISSGKIKSDCADLRFIDSNDTTVLSYWIESGCNTSNTQIWVRIPSIPTGTKSIYMYYGNPSAPVGQTSWSGTFTMLASATCPIGTYSERNKKND